METQDKTNLIPLPNEVSKIKFEKMYRGQLPEGVITSGINEIIYDNRKKLKGYEGKSRRSIISTHKVLLVEMIEFADTYSLPRGYCKPENY